MKKIMIRKKLNKKTQNNNQIKKNQIFNRIKLKLPNKKKI